MKEKLISNSVIIIFVTLLYSCDAINQVNYDIRNNSSETIVIDSVVTDNGLLQGQYPSNLESGNVSSVLIYEVIGSRVRNPEGQTRLGHLKNIVIYRLRDSAYLQSDIRLRDNWIYKETGKHTANLELIIKNEDFTK